MKLGVRGAIILAAALALVIGISAYSLSEAEHEHEEEGLIEGDTVKVAAVGGVLALVAVLSFAYLAKMPPEEV